MASLLKRGKKYYAQYYLGGKPRRVSLATESLQLAKEKLRQLESSLARGEDSPLPTKTRLPDILDEYVRHIRAVKTAKSAQTDIYYLREAFGEICGELTCTSRKRTEAARKCKLLPGIDNRRRLQRIEANHMEEIGAAQVSRFIADIVQARGLAPKTANRYREILCRLFNWAMKERGVQMPGDKNPVASVSRYKEHAPKIRFLTLPQIDEQLAALAPVKQEEPAGKVVQLHTDTKGRARLRRQIRTMVAMYIYAGLRREEALWLQMSDIDLRAGQYGMIRIQAKEVDGETWEPKTKVNRAVPISSSLRQYLDAYRPLATQGNWLFPSPEGHRYDPDNFSQALRVLQNEAGLVWGCLDFRHTFGSHLAMKGESLYKISTLMGNSPEICRRHYAALIPEAMVDTVEFSRHIGMSARRFNNSKASNGFAKIASAPDASA